MPQVNQYCFVDDTQPIVRSGGDFWVLLGLLPVICAARIVCEKIGRAIFLQSSVAITRKRKKLALSVKKFEESFWKFSYYFLAALYGLCFISWEQYLRIPFEQFPNNLQPKLYWYYMVQISFYLWMCVCLFYDVRKKDFYQMAAHHVVTLVLLVLSYSYNLFNVGSLIMILHDFADPFLEFAKMMNYMKKEVASTLAFAGFMLSFLGMRLIVYPLYAVHPAVFQTYELAVYAERVYAYYIINGSLLILLGLNVFWSYLIVRVLVKKLCDGKMEDNRSDEEYESD